MSDHASGPRAFADPVIDITDIYAFPSPERPGVLVLALNVFPFAGPTALFSDAVDYQFRLRPVTFSPAGDKSFAVGEKEVTITCRFAIPTKSKDGRLSSQQGTCCVSSGQSASFRVNDEQGGQSPGLRVFAGVRLDPFFFDGSRAVMTLMTGKLSFEKVGHATVFRQNVLSIIVELDNSLVTSASAGGPLFAVVGETVKPGTIQVRLERYGRPEIKNLLLWPKQFDSVNRDIEIRDLYNQEDAFNLANAYLSAYRSRMNGTLAFWDGLGGKTDWALGEHGTHPLTELLLRDFMVVDVSKPFSENSSYDTERALMKGTNNTTCGGRWFNDDTVDTYLTLLITAGNGPRISDGVDQATVPATRTFPYLAPPEQNPPPVKGPAVKT